MDPSSSDLEFFDFKNSSNEEIKEIQAILKGPGSNGCVELPWEISVSNNKAGVLSDTKEVTPEAEVVPEADVAATPIKNIENAPVPPPNFAPPPESQLPPGVETFVTLPTTVGPYQNAPYFVSRTLPYLRAYPPMGMPFFACPLPGDGSPYGHILPVPAENPPPPETPKIRQSNKKVKKRTDSIENGEVPIGPSSVPLVPLPPSTFAVAGYPPGLHTLPYPQMAGQSSPAMYYVPVFNHPYGGYLPSPPIMLPEELNETRVVDIEKTSPADFDVHQTCEVVELKEDLALPTAKPAEEQTVDSSVEPLSKESSPGYVQDSENCMADAENKASTESLSIKHSKPEACSLENVSVERVATNVLPEEAPKTLPPKTAPLNNCIPEKTSPCLTEPIAQKTSHSEVDEVLTDKNLKETSTNKTDQTSVNEIVRPVVKGCWADLFKSPREMNGIDRHPPKKSTLKKDVANGKVYSVPEKR